MERLNRLAVAVVAAIVLLAAARIAARADRVNAPRAAADTTGAVQVAPVGPPLSAAHLESVLTDPRGAVTGQKQGNGWLLHYGRAHDSCARPGATSRLRVLCVSW